MLTHIAKILRVRPMLALEFVQYVKLLAFSIWGLNLYDNVATLRNLNLFGEIITNGANIFGIVCAVAGIFSVITARIEHRKLALLATFFAFSFSGVMSIVMYLTLGHPHIVTLIMCVSGAITCGIFRIHHHLLYEEGLRGKRISHG